MTDIRDLPQPDAVIFDLDGTLVDSVETRIRAWLQTFDEIGIATSRDELVPLIGLDGKRLAREVSALRGQPIDDGRSEVIDKRCGEIYEELNSDPRPLPGCAPPVRHDRRTWPARRHRDVEPEGAGEDVRSMPWAWPGSRRSSTQATSSTRSPNPTSCCELPRNSVSTRRGPGTSATRRGTWSRRSRRR
jgi:hypothetical protein